MSDVTDSKVELDERLLVPLVQLDDILRTAIRLLCGKVPDNDREWVLLTKHYLKLSEEVIPLDRFPRHFEYMKESNFRDLYGTGEKIFSEFTDPLHDHALPFHTDEQKKEVTRAWENFKEKVKICLPALDFDVDPAAAIELHLIGALSTIRLHGSECTASQLRRFEELMSDLEVEMSFRTRPSETTTKI